MGGNILKFLALSAMEIEILSDVSTTITSEELGLTLQKLKASAIELRGGS